MIVHDYGFGGHGAMDVERSCHGCALPVRPTEDRELGFPEDDGSRAVWHKSCFDAAVKENW